jgi:hypothetical protein
VLTRDRERRHREGRSPQRYHLRTCHSHQDCATFFEVRRHDKGLLSRLKAIFSQCHRLEVEQPPPQPLCRCLRSTPNSLSRRIGVQVSPTRIGPLVRKTPLTLHETCLSCPPLVTRFYRFSTDYHAQQSQAKFMCSEGRATKFVDDGKSPISLNLPVLHLQYILMHTHWLPRQYGAVSGGETRHDASMVYATWLERFRAGPSPDPL